MPRVKVERGIVMVTVGFWPYGFAVAVGHLPTLRG